MWRNNRDSRFYSRDDLTNKDLVIVEDSQWEVFSHNGRFFALRTKSADEDAEVWSLGRSTSPIAALMNDAHRFADVNDEKNTVLYVGFPRGYRLWPFGCRTPIRPMNTIELSTGQTDHSFRDVGEILARPYCQVVSLAEHTLSAWVSVVLDFLAKDSQPTSATYRIQVTI
jgi:BCS1 N terminal